MDFDWSVFFSVPKELQLLFSKYKAPWQITEELDNFLMEIIKNPNGIFIDPAAKIEKGAKVYSPAYIGKDCFVSWNSLLRKGVFLGKGVTVGPGCEIKQSIILANTTCAHFNYVGNSVIGSKVNLAAGAIVTNYKNEFKDKNIYVTYKETREKIPVQKFGALIGSNVNIGSNSVIAPGSVIESNVNIGALELISGFVLRGKKLLEKNSYS